MRGFDPVPPRRVLLLLMVVLHVTIPVSAAVSDPERAALVQGVEDSLLKMFSFARRPRPDRSQVVIPEALIDLYHRQTGVEVETTALNAPGRHTRSANTVRTFTHVESPVDGKFSEHSNRFRLLFNLQGIPAIERLQAADLQLTRVVQQSATAASSARRVRVLVHDIIRPGHRGDRQPILRLIDSKVLDVHDYDDKRSGVTFDVLPAVQRWRASPSDNHGLLVEVLSKQKNKHGHVRLRRAAHESPSNETWLRQQPLLFTYTDDLKHKSVVKRGAPSRKYRRKESRENCQRHSLYVNFEEVGWNDWIVAPPGYDAYYCHGDCPFPLAEHLNTTNHAVVQTLMHSMSPGLVPKACCVPTELSSISMLYLDEKGKAVLKNYKDMAVQGCGCR